MTLIDMDETKPLNVLIIGAGLGGLTAAIALRRQGHSVKIFEQSRFASELGAAINVPPNAYGVLLHLGVDPALNGAVEMKYITEYDKTGTQVKVTDFASQSSRWQHPWLLAHRVDLQNQLKDAATCSEGIGEPAIIYTNSRVTGVDMKGATITLENGDVITGDVVIGADGIHKSKSRTGLTEKVPAQTCREVPMTQKIVEKNGNMAFWFGTDRRIVMYPTRWNEILNFVCIHPDKRSEPASETWNEVGHLENMLKAFEGFDSCALELLKMADPCTLKVWRLMDMDPISSWNNGSFALLGDAAHPFLPHQGQGGAQAMEDAVCLGIVLHKGVRSSEVPERLQLYQEIRKGRAEKVQALTRMSGEDIKEGSRNNLDKVMEFFIFNVSHDETHNLTQIVHKWALQRGPSPFWRMPVSFGPLPGPRQDVSGLSRILADTRYITTSLKIKTSRTLLQNLLPTASYCFSSPDTVAYASFTHTRSDKLDWLRGRGYDFWSFSLHGVEYNKKDGTTLSGTFMPVVFENLTDPILSGRDELGWPKLYADIDVKRSSKSFSMTSHWCGESFAFFNLDGLEPVNDPPRERQENIFVHKYIPATGNKGVADVEYPVCSPITPPSGRRFQTKEGAVSFKSGDWTSLPTIHHIVRRLEELPVYEFVEGTVVEGSGISDLGGTYRIE
ncbi:3-hydroxybenzoate 6-hydroxylase 1 [Talaromyces pinophilus]|nr:3-hydroxybenzoate 6-hydroxylase 1 [Talaromyces pinophilus]